jgi:hypothetical protein
MNMRKSAMLLQLLVLTSAHGAAPADQARSTRIKRIIGGLCLGAAFANITAGCFYAAAQEKSTPSPIEPDQLVILGQKCGGISVQNRECSPSEICNPIISLAPTCSVFNSSSEIIDSCPQARLWGFWENSCGENHYRIGPNGIMETIPQTNPRCFSERFTKELISSACKTVQPIIEIESISREPLEMRNTTLFNTTKMVGTTPHEKLKIKRKRLREHRISKK